MSARTNLQPHADRFVGRGEELSRLREILRPERLVTIAGTAGVGKTRLAHRLALDFASDITDGCVWFCDLTEARSVEDVCSVAAQTLGASLGGCHDADDAVETVGRELAVGRVVLLVLDNFDRLAESAAYAVGAWVAAAKNTRFVVASRTRLRLAGELVFELGPLTIGAPSAPAGGEALELFLDRARAARPAGEILTDVEIAAAAETVRILEGIPLAIEIAAARTSVLTPVQLVRRLSRRIDALGAIRDPKGRPLTLRAAIDASWELLDETDQRALARSSVFRGGFEIDAAEAVLAGEAGHPILDVIQRLRDRSLLQVRPAVGGGERRYVLYESIREYAAERLCEMGDETATLEQHACYFLEGATRWAGGAFAVGGGAELLTRLANEHDNLMAIVDRALDAEPPTVETAARALNALVALEPLVRVRGPFAGHAALLERAMARADLIASSGVRIPSSTRAGALVARANVYRSLGRIVDSVADYEQAAASCSEERDHGLKVGALVGLAIAYMNFGEPDRSKAEWEHALRMALEVGDRAAEGFIRTSLAHVAANLDDDAIDAMRLGIAIAKEVGNTRAEYLCTSQLALAYLRVGDIQRAREYFEATVSMARAVGDRCHEAVGLHGLAILEHERERFAESERLVLDAIGLYATVGLRQHEATAQVDLALLRLEQGRLDDAAAGAEGAAIVLAAVRDDARQALALLVHGAIVLSFRDANKNVIFDEKCGFENSVSERCRYSATPPANASYGKTFQINHEAFVPEGTKFIRVEITGSGKAGAGEDRYWDRVILKPIGL